MQIGWSRLSNRHRKAPAAYPRTGAGEAKSAGTGPFLADPAKEARVFDATGGFSRELRRCFHSSGSAALPVASDNDKFRWRPLELTPRDNRGAGAVSVELQGPQPGKIHG